MAWTFDVAALFDGDRKHVVRVVGTSDGTAADDTVTAVDRSTLTGAGGQAVTALTVYKLEWSTEPALKVAFDHTTDDEIANLSGGDSLDWEEVGGLADPGSAGGTGDVTITTVDTAANDTFTATLWCRKEVD